MAELTRTNRLILQGLRDHGQTHWHARGLQQFGGFTASCKSLVARGLIEYDEEWRYRLTAAGREALAAMEAHHA